MTSRTTVAIDKELRKKLKKLSAWLDITQSEVIRQALAVYERELFQKKEGSIKEKDDKDDQSIILMKNVLRNATEIIWKKDPERKAIQKKLSSGIETIDDYILNHWESGLD